MNYLILNRDFRLPEDGWYHIAPLGEFPHAGAGVIQVIDQEACIAMAARFGADAKTPNFPGLLVDFDHFSLDGEKRSEAAGWIIGLEYRENGLWAQIRWSDLGEEAVKGGRYRFLSPVWTRTDCVDLGPDPQSGRDKVRPIRILNAAVTNDPNLKGMVPLSNRSQETSTSTDVTADRKNGTQNTRVVDFFPLDSAKNNFLRNGPSDGKAMEGKEGRSMNAVIEKLVNHLGLAADATEAVILEKMGGLITATVVTELQNSLATARTELDALKGTLKGVEGELVNRHLEEFAGVVTEKTKEFWTSQLMTNRQTALAALEDLAAGREAGGQGDGVGKKKGDGGDAGAQGSTRKPLHNRTTARPVIPGQGNPSAGAGLPEGQAVKIRNRAHEIAKAESVPFSVAFRRAEREVLGNG